MPASYSPGEQALWNPDSCLPTGIALSVLRDSFPSNRPLNLQGIPNGVSVLGESLLMAAFLTPRLCLVEGISELHAHTNKVTR